VAGRTQMGKPPGTGWLLYKSRKVLSVLRKVFEGGRYRRIFGVHASNLPYPDIVSGYSCFI